MIHSVSKACAKTVPINVVNKGVDAHCDGVYRLAYIVADFSPIKFINKAINCVA